MMKHFNSILFHKFERANRQHTYQLPISLTGGIPHFKTHISMEILGIKPEIDVDIQAYFTCHNNYYSIS